MVPAVVPQKSADERRSDALPLLDGPAQETARAGPCVLPVLKRAASAEVSPLDRREWTWMYVYAPDGKLHIRDECEMPKPLCKRRQSERTQLKGDFAVVQGLDGGRGTGRELCSSCVLRLPTALQVPLVRRFEQWGGDWELRISKLRGHPIEE